MNVELVAFGIEHVDKVAAALFNRPGFAASDPKDPLDLGVDPAAALVLGRAKPAPDVQVEMNPVFYGFPFWNLLEVDTRAHAIRIDDGVGRVPFTFGNPLRLQEVRPRGKARWWVLKLVVQRSGPEGCELRRVAAVEHNLNAGGHPANITRALVLAVASACGSRP